MTKHCQVYCDYFDFKVQSEIMCEACGSPAGRHYIIFHGRGKGKVIENLNALCGVTKHGHLKERVTGEFQYIHNCYLTGKRQTFLK